MTSIPPSAASPRKSCAEGIDARERLLQSGLRLFAEKGFANTSTREIAQSARINIASISYYFGDKAGLYRAVFTETNACPSLAPAEFDQSELSLRESLQTLFNTILAPLKLGDTMQMYMRLHFREMLEPTGIWAEKIDHGIKPAHAGLIRLLCRHLGLTKADDDLHRLAFSVTGLALQIFIDRDVIDAIRPRLLATPRALDAWSARLVDFAEAMVMQEATRRQTPPQ